MKKFDFFYIDPQSYSNLSIYDYNLLSHFDKQNLLYLHSKKYDYKSIEGWNEKPVFIYNSIAGQHLKALSYVWSYIRIFFLIALYKPKVVHMQWFKLPGFDHLFVKLTKKLFGTQYVFTAHNVLPHNTGNRHAGIYRKLYHAVNRIIVHTPATVKEIVSKFDIPENKITVIPHGILQPDIDEQLYRQSVGTWNRKYDTKGKIVFSSLGEQSRYKGIDLLAEVWAQTPELRDNDNLLLLIVGKQVNIDLSALSACNNVIMENSRISNEEFYYLLKHTDVYVLPYRNISQSGALLTALSTRTPFAATNVGGLCDPLKVAPVGWEISGTTFKDIQQQLVNISMSPEKIRAIKNSHDDWEKINDYYAWKHISHATMTLYQSMCDKG
ncbi:MAG: glycosyltransferase [Prevotella sp.]|uniref:glycosyltransferase n=1 Tax=Prevotella sp. TaxID=59823 RepID=UPI002A2DF13F|nr:glycosyltransferase [Prevotella sp.]MDD7317455.1 glycosyltransferase [Prevotellaceae bacterium]MDY4019209.1 glycosyltransferase [Prevotella sp.]